MLQYHSIPSRPSRTCSRHISDHSLWLCASLPQSVNLQVISYTSGVQYLPRDSSRHELRIKNITKPFRLFLPSKSLNLSLVFANRNSGSIQCMYRSEKGLLRQGSDDDRIVADTPRLILRQVESKVVAAMIADLRECVPDSSIGPEAAPNIEIFLSLGTDVGQLRRMVRQNPALLGYDASVRILPLILLFHKFGISQEDIVRCMAGNLRSCSVKASQAESVLLYMRDELGIADLSKVLVGMSTILGMPVPTLRKKASFLEEVGIQHVGKLLAKNNGCLNPSMENIAEKVDFIKQLCEYEDISRLVALDPTILTSSIHTMKDSLEKYSARWGRENALKLVRKYPQTLSQTWKNKEKKLDYVENTMRRSFDEILNCPVILRYSLEKRIIPRYELLLSVGEEHAALNTFLPISDEAFQRKYIFKDS